MIRNVEFFQQFLYRRDLVGFFVDLDMRQNQRRAGSERAEHLFRACVVEGVKTAFEHLAVERQSAHARNRFAAVQVCGMFAKSLLDILRLQPLQNETDRRMGGGPFPANLERLVQLLPMNLDESFDASIRVRAAHNSQNGKKQNMRQLIKFALSAARVWDQSQQRKKLFKGFHGDPPLVWSPAIDSEFLSHWNPPFPSVLQFVIHCCFPDSL